MKKFRNLAFYALSLALAFSAHAEPAPPTTASSATAPGGERTQTVAPAPDGTDALSAAIRRGATMEEIARLSDPIANSPTEAILALKRGNARFYGGSARRPELSANERRAQVLAQTPFATIIGCSDSRVPVEIVFDQGLGTLFISRVAGNIASPDTLGSVDYSIEHLKTHLVVVMGHEGCGAVQAAMLPSAEIAKESRYVQYLVGRIQPAVADIPMLRDRKARLREAVIANVRLQTYLVKQDPVIVEAIKEGKIGVIGAYYEIGSGAVDFLTSEEDLKLSPAELARARTLIAQNGDAKTALAALIEQDHQGHDHK